MQNKSPFLQSIASMIRVARYSKRTITSYLYWIKYFILSHHKQYPQIARCVGSNTVYRSECSIARPILSAASNKRCSLVV